MRNKGSIGVELDMDWDVTEPKKRRVVDDSKKKKKATRKYDSSSSSEDDGTLSDWDGVEDYTGKTTVRYEAPPKGKRRVTQKPAAEPVQRSDEDESGSSAIEVSSEEK